MEKLDPDLLEQVIDIEWDMFSTAPNEGGPAECQSQRGTFEIMRKAQAATWNNAVLESYLQDLRDAQAMGRNLMTEKYGRMEQVTFPEEYAKIAHLLPPVSEEVQSLVHELAALHLVWDREAAEKYPLLRGRGRPLTGRQGDPETSAQTYLEGEYSTFSARTLRLLVKREQDAFDSGENLVIEQLDATVRAYGWASIDAAEAHLRGKRKAPRG